MKAGPIWTLSFDFSTQVTINKLIMAALYIVADKKIIVFTVKPAGANVIFKISKSQTCHFMIQRRK
jgi:archaellum biogenesis ATPase FlaH